MSLCSKDDVKSFLVITDTAKDDLIDLLIPAAQSFIEEYCHRIFDKAECTEYYHGGTDKIFVKRPPIFITPVVKVYEDWDRKYAESTLIVAEDYHIDYDLGVLYFDYFLEKGWGSIKVIYTGGFNTPPAAVKQACIELVSHKLKTGTLGDIGLESKVIPGGTQINFSMEEILPATRKALDLFVR